jgi:hypothetical protein
MAGGASADTNQTATNGAVVEQIGIATSGSATSFWGYASSDATVKNEAEVKQSILQVATCDCNATQTATNGAAVGQLGDALSGDAWTKGGIATADATVKNEAEVRQKVKQISFSSLLNAQ